MSDFPPCPDPHSDVHYFDMRLRFEHEFANGVNAKFAPLALVVHSGGKSLHGWAACAGIAEDELRKFMAYACELGADP
jgi:hypothetical protein